MDTYQSEAEIEAIVRGFESCETGADDFKHRDHLVVAIWYLQTMDKQAALDRMRDGLLRFLNHHVGDTTKYSEEITGFWIERVAQKLDELGSEATLVEKSNRVVESTQLEPQIYADKKHGLAG